MQARSVCPNPGEEYAKVTRGAHGAGALPVLILKQ